MPPTPINVSFMNNSLLPSSYGLEGLPCFACRRGLALQLTAPSHDLPCFDVPDVKRRVAVLERIPEPLRFGPTVPRRLHPLVWQSFSHGGIELPRVSHVRHRPFAALSPGERARPPGPPDGPPVPLASWGC